MGELFEGREIMEDSLKMAKWFIYGNSDGKPPRGETFNTWRDRWMWWLATLKYGFSAIGIVTHNRNIQYLYALHRGKFVPHMYDVHGPDFCSVHYYDRRTGEIAPWGGNNIVNGLYLIRHGETFFGT